MEKFKHIEQPAIAKLEVSQSPHNMPCIQVENPSARLRNIIRQAIMANHIDDLAYELRTDAGAFLQSDSDDYILVEFGNQATKNLLIISMNKLVQKKIFNCLILI